MRALHLALIVACAAAAAAADAAAAWPSWLGPGCDGSAAPVGRPLVGRPQDIRELWTSADPLPNGRAPDASDKLHDSVGGGLNSAVADGERLYFGFYVPRGDVLDKGLAAKQVQYANGVSAAKWAIDADDVVVAIDLKTGATAWKTVFAGKGLNFGMFNKAGPSSASCVSAGRVVHVGTTGLVYCLDAATGKPLWESSIGERAQKLAALKAQCLREQVLPQFNRDFRNCPVVVGGVVVTSDFRSYKVQSPVKEFNWGDENGLVGIDLADGTVRWRVPACLGWASSPLRWTHAGVERVLAAGDSGRITCIDPRSGAVLWTAPAGKTGSAAIVAGDRMIANAATEGGQVACWTLTPAGATKAWELPPGEYPSCPPVAIGGHVYLVMRKAGEMLCVALADGKVVARTKVAGSGWMVGVDGLLLVQADGGHGHPAITLVKADPADLKVLGTWTVPMCASYTTPMMPPVVGSRIHLRLDDRFAAFELARP